MNNLNGLETQLRTLEQEYIAARRQADRYTKQVRSDEKTAKLLEIRNEIESWVKMNPKATEAQLQEKFRGLLPKSKLFTVKKERLAAGINTYVTRFAEDYVLVKERQISNNIAKALAALKNVIYKYISYFVKAGYRNSSYNSLLTWKGRVEITSNKEAARHSISREAVISVDLRKSYYACGTEGEYSCGDSSVSEVITPHTTIMWPKPTAWPAQIDTADIDNILSAYSIIKGNPVTLLTAAEFAEAQAQALSLATAQEQAREKAQKEREAAPRKNNNGGIILPPYDGGKMTLRRKNNGKRKTRSQRRL